MQAASRGSPPRETRDRRPLRVNLAILIGQFPPGVFGGAELQAEQWAVRLATRHVVTVVTRANPQAPAGRTSRDGFDVIRLPVSRWPGLRSFRDLGAIRRAVKELEPRPDLLLCFQTFISGFAGVGLQRSLGIPAVVWVRGEDELRLRAIRIARWTSPGVWRQARGVIVQSPEIRDALLSELPAGRRAEVAAHLECVPNGIRLPAPHAAGARGDRVLTVGRLVDIKGGSGSSSARRGCARTSGSPGSSSGKPWRVSIATRRAWCSRRGSAKAFPTWCSRRWRTAPR